MLVTRTTFEPGDDESTVVVQIAEREVSASLLFRDWKPRHVETKTPEGRIGEPHYSPAELGKAWGVHAQTIRNLFQHEPDVLRFGQPGDKRRRKYVSMKIPQSVAERVHRRLSAVPHQDRN
jgi:hypothetical protein